MPYWLDWMKRDTKFSLLKDNKNQLLSDTYVRRQLNKGVDPVELSIEKWIRIQKVFEELILEPLPLSYLFSLSQYIGYKSCALCLYSLEEYIHQYGKIKYGSDKCKVCALAMIDQCTKNESTFKQIENIFLNIPIEVKKEYEEKTIKRVRELIKKMIENIVKIKKSEES